MPDVMNSKDWKLNDSDWNLLLGYFRETHPKGKIRTF